MKWRDWERDKNGDFIVDEYIEYLYRYGYVEDILNELLKNNDEQGFQKFITERYYSTPQERKFLWKALNICYQKNNGKISPYDKPISKLELIYHFETMVGKLRNGERVRFKKYWWNDGYVTTDDYNHITTKGRDKDVDWSDFDNNDDFIWKEIYKAKYLDEEEKE